MIIFDGAGEASEPSGEGASSDEIDYIDDDGIGDNIDGDGGGQYVDFLFIEIRIFYLDSVRQIRILTPSRVELIGKTSIFGLQTTTNR